MALITLDPHWKDMNVAQLRALLNDLPDDLRVGCNDVGNLVVLEIDDNERRYRGYIDFLNETLQLDDQS